MSGPERRGCDGMTSRFYAVVAPQWRAMGWPAPGLLTRPWLRWQVVRETRDPAPAGEISTWSHEYISKHWTLRAAQRAADSAASHGD